MLRRTKGDGDDCHGFSPVWEIERICAVNVAPHALHSDIPLGSGLGAGISRTSPFRSYRFDDPTTSGTSPSEADVTDGDSRDASDLSSMTGLFSRKTGETRQIFDLSRLQPSRWCERIQNVGIRSFKAVTKTNGGRR